MAIALCEINEKVLQSMSPEIVDRLFEKFGERTGIGVNLIDPKPNNPNSPTSIYTIPNNNFPPKSIPFGNYIRLPFVHQDSLER